ncbi:MAG: methylmalonyl Co-A mutase-associated GTPase MeaB [Salibacteraceae bacterium]
MNTIIDIDKLLQGDLLTLSRAITLVESSIPVHRQEALHLINAIYSKRKSAIRIGITGIPGVGKSTFIEQFGKTILAEGKKLAVLAIDPSSQNSGGSILGDKTRMEELSREKSAFIRPSPSSGTLGGVAARTRESMLLCEAAGFDVILIETVGVGQSETEVINITDCFMMLAMPGTGDDLQGIKRGIMEAADIIVINKADGSNADAARKAKRQLEMALHLFPVAQHGWATKVLTASALNNEGVENAWKTVKGMIGHMKEQGQFEQKRLLQQELAFEKLTSVSIYEYVMQNLGKNTDINRLKKAIIQGKQNEFSASLEVLESLSKMG